MNSESRIAILAALIVLEDKGISREAPVYQNLEALLDEATPQSKEK